MAVKVKSIYVCSNCGETSPRWMGKCPGCGSWNTMTEEVVEKQDSALRGAAQSSSAVKQVQAVQLQAVDLTEREERVCTGITEFDRVLGGGIVLGSVVLLGGEPGVGKSTLLLQVCGALSDKGYSVLYFTGEESARQVKIRADRLHIKGENITIAAESDVDAICSYTKQNKPDFMVVDSIQTMHSTELSSGTGTVTQIRECTAKLMDVAKANDLPLFIIGHVNKEGAIAGPKVMEHIVDTVLYFEGDKLLPYRILRSAKNRFGSTNEIGMFDMVEQGLHEIVNPSEQLLSGRALGISGSCVVSTMEGSRAVLTEIQALAVKSNFAVPRRTCSGYDYNRMNLLMAVIEKRAGFCLSGMDVYINVVGGLMLHESACDLSVCLSIISSILDQPIPDKTIAIGEIGLGGELRQVPNIELRLKEANRIGFKTAIIPAPSIKNVNPKDFPNVKLIGAAFLTDALKIMKSLQTL